MSALFTAKRLGRVRVPVCTCHAVAHVSHKCRGVEEPGLVCTGVREQPQTCCGFFLLRACWDSKVVTGLPHRQGRGPWGSPERGRRMHDMMYGRVFWGFHLVLGWCFKAGIPFSFVGSTATSCLVALRRCWTSRQLSASRHAAKPLKRL
jgi:hypothetical protein